MKIRCLLICVTTLALFSCEEKILEPISGSKGKPGIITDVVQTPIPGGVEITYRIPNDEDILGVKTEYILSNGQKRESITSFYNNTLRLEGFNDTDEHEALVYTVNLAQELSEPVPIRFTPLESPLTKTVKSIEILADWSGVQFRWKNLDKVPLDFEFLAVDSLTNALKPARIIASDKDSLSQVLRGYKPEPQKFAMLVSDLFGNKSDTIYPASGYITPLFEERLNKQDMSFLNLDNDETYTRNSGNDGRQDYLIDDDVTRYGQNQNGDAVTRGAPFSLNLGHKVKLSRFVIHNRLMTFDDGGYYFWGNPRFFRVYIATSTPQQSGDWSEWTKVLDCEIVKPSGLPGTQSNSADTEFGDRGFDFAFPLDIEAAQYVRFEILETWSLMMQCHIAEITLYGQLVED